MRSVDRGRATFGRREENPDCPFTRALRRRFFKRTAQREAVWDVLCHTEDHLTPEALLREAATRGHSLSIATVYRTLKLFRQAGMVRKLEFGDGQSRYELLDDADSHLHLVCEQCGRTFDVADPQVIHRYRELAAAYGFVLHHQATCLYGVCDACAGNQRLMEKEIVMSDMKRQCRGHGTSSGGRGPSSFRLQSPEAVFGRMAMGKGDVFVDVGCGAGDYSLAAAAIVGETGRVFALDQSRESIDWLNACGRMPGAAGINGLVCDITDSLPLENGMADVAMLGTVLHIRWVREKADRLLAEIRRVLRPGGMLAVLECKKEEADFGPPLHSRLSPDELADLVVPLGFREESELLLNHTYLACFRAD